MFIELFVFEVPQKKKKEKRMTLFWNTNHILAYLNITHLALSQTFFMEQFFSCIFMKTGGKKASTDKF